MPRLGGNLAFPLAAVFQNSAGARVMGCGGDDFAASAGWFARKY
jgi:hypothetical protein